MKGFKETAALGGLSLADQLVVSGTTFLTMILVSKNCSKADVGIFALTWTVVGFLRTVQERIVAAPYLAFAYRPTFDRPSFRGSSLLHQCGLAAIGTLLILLVSSLVGWFAKDVYLVKLLLSLSVALPLILLRDQIRAMSAVRFQFAMQLFFDIAISMLQIGGIIFLGWMNRFSLSWVNVILGMACVPALFIWYLQSRKSIRFDLGDAWTDWKHNWSYSKWLLAARIFGIGGYIAVPWMIWYFLDESATGAFAICNSMVGISLVCVTGANNMFQPRTVRELQRSGVKAMLMTVFETIGVVVSILAIVSLVFFFFGGFCLKWIYGPAYQEYGFLAFLLSLSTLAVCTSIIFGNGLAALGNSKEYFWGEFYCFVVSIGAAWYLIPSMGLHGGAISLVLGGLTASIVTGFTLARGVLLHTKQSHALLANE